MNSGFFEKRLNAGIKVTLRILMSSILPREGKLQKIGIEVWLEERLCT
jgi:hypothetical protein